MPWHLQWEPRAETHQRSSSTAHDTAGPGVHKNARPPAVRPSRAHLYDRRDRRSGIPMVRHRRLFLEYFLSKFSVVHVRRRLGSIADILSTVSLARVPRSSGCPHERRAESTRGTLKKRSDATTIEHPGRQFIPLAYVLGAMILIGGTIAASAYGQVSMVPALLMPWAGFYWIRLFLWRRVIKVEKAGAVKS